MNGDPIIAFIEKGLKFSQCTQYTDITSGVVCKVNGSLQYYVEFYHQNSRMLKLLVR